MNLGFPEMVFIFIIALVIFGPKKLPEIGRQIGRFMGEFKRASNEFKWQLENEMRQLETEEKQKKGELPKWESPVNSISYKPGSELQDVPQLNIPSDDVSVLPPVDETVHVPYTPPPGPELNWDGSPVVSSESKTPKPTDA